MSLEVQKLVRIQSGCTFDDSLKRKLLLHFIQREELGLIIQRPAQPHECIQHPGWQETNLLIIRHHYRRQCIRLRIDANAAQDLIAQFEQLLKLRIGAILVDLALTHFLFAARRGNVRNMSPLRSLIPERSMEQHLNRRVRQMFLGTDHMSNLQGRIVDDGGKVVERRPVTTSHHWIRHQTAIPFDATTYMIVDHDLVAARNQQANNERTPFRNALQNLIVAQ